MIKINFLKDYFRTCKLNQNPYKSEVVSFQLSNILANYRLMFYSVQLSRNKHPQCLRATASYF